MPLMTSQGSVLLEGGSLALRDLEALLRVNPGLETCVIGHVLVDTANTVLLHTGMGIFPVRLDLPRQEADRILARLSASARIHGYPHYVVRPSVGPDGAQEKLGAFNAILCNFGQVKATINDAIAYTQARTHGPLYGVSSGSPVSNTMAALHLTSPFALRPALQGATRGDDARLDSVALAPELTDGADDHRYQQRRATFYATLLAEERLALVHERRLPRDQSGTIEFPGLGTVTGPLYDQTLVCFPSLLRAENVDDAMAAQKFIVSLFLDRNSAMGKMLAEDAARNTGTTLRALQSRGRWRSRKLAVPAAVKVTVDRRALARRASQWATVIALEALANGTSTRHLSESIIPRRFTLQAYDKDGDKFAPHFPEWRPGVAITQNVVEDLRQLIEEEIRRCIADWDGQRLSEITETIEREFAKAEQARILAGNLGNLAAERRGVADQIAQHRKALTSRSAKDLAKKEKKFRDLCANPLGSGLLSPVLGPLLAETKLRSAATAYALARFRHHRLEALADILKRLELEFQRSTTETLEALVNEVKLQVADGPYLHRTHGHWDEMRHPAPNITVLYAEPEEFADLFYEANVLAGRQPNGHVVIRQPILEQAVQDLYPDFRRAFDRGRQGFTALTRACEQHFARLYEDHWSQLHVSRLPEEKLERALQAGLTALRPGDLVERISGVAQAPESLIYALPAADPKIDSLRQIVRRSSHKNMREVQEDRAHESAIIAVHVVWALSMDELIPVRPGSESHKAFLAALYDFHAGQTDAAPPFPSRWLEQLVAENNPDMRAVVAEATRVRLGKRHFDPDGRDRLVTAWATSLGEEPLSESMNHFWRRNGHEHQGAVHHSKNGRNQQFSTGKRPKANPQPRSRGQNGA